MTGIQQYTDWSLVPLFLSAADVAQILGLSLPNTYALFKRSSFPAIRLSPKRIGVEREAFRAWLSGQPGV